MRNSRTGFTLIELLVVITIIAILMALLVPAVQMIRETGNRTTCSQNLKQIAAAVINYELHYKHFPPGRIGCDGIDQQAPYCTKETNDFARVGGSGFIGLLPFLDQQPLFLQFDFKDGPFRAWTSGESEANALATSQVVKVYRCPSDTGESYKGKAATGSYALNVGDNNNKTPSMDGDLKVFNTGLFAYVNVHQTEDVTDGMSNTFMVGEASSGHIQGASNRWSVASRHDDSLRHTKNAMNTPIGDPAALNAYGYTTNGAYRSDHMGGAFFAFGDTHVYFLNENMDMNTYRALSTRGKKDKIKNFQP